MVFNFHIQGRKKELLFTVCSNFILQLVTVGCGLILPPMIIRTYGSAMNGMVASITQFIAYLNIVEAGVGGAAIAALYKPIAENNLQKQNGILTAVAQLYIKSGYLFTLLIGILAIIYPFFVKGQVGFLTAGTMVLFMGITGVADFFLIGKYRILLTAYKKFYVISVVQAVATILNTLCSVLLIRQGCNLLTVKLTASLLYLSRFIIISFYAKKRYPFLSFQDIPEQEAMEQSRNVLVHQIAGLIVFNFPVVILTMLCSLQEVSVYSVYAMIFLAVRNLLGIFTAGSHAFFGESLVLDSLEKTRIFFSRYETIFFLILGSIYSLFFLLLLPFIRLYTAGMSDIDYIQPSLMFLLVAAGIGLGLGEPGILLINGAGHFKKTQYRPIIEVIINIICSVTSVWSFGFAGVVLGTICSSYYRAIDTIIYARKKILFMSPVGSFLKIITIGVYYFCVVSIARLIVFQANNYSQWIVQGFLYACIICIPISVVLLLLRGKKNDT